MLASAPLLPKFVSERAAIDHELRKRALVAPESVLVFSAKDNYLRRGHLHAAMDRILACNQAFELTGDLP